jgi:hypothetical protein
MAKFLANLKHGALHRDLGIAQSKNIPVSALMAASHSKNPLTRKRANFAISARKWHHGGK